MRDHLIDKIMKMFYNVIYIHSIYYLASLPIAKERGDGVQSTTSKITFYDIAKGLIKSICILHIF